MERPPTSARTPENGTAMEAMGTPCDAAKAITGLVKWRGPDITKIRANRKRPSRTMGPRPGCEVVNCDLGVDAIFESPSFSWRQYMLSGNLSNEKQANQDGPRGSFPAGACIPPGLRPPSFLSL